MTRMLVVMARLIVKNGHDSEDTCVTMILDRRLFNADTMIMGLINGMIDWEALCDHVKPKHTFLFRAPSPIPFASWFNSESQNWNWQSAWFLQVASIWWDAFRIPWIDVSIERSFAWRCLRSWWPPYTWATYRSAWTMSGKNHRRLVADEPVEAQDFRKLPVIYRNL